jgi:hypothetical protein
VPLDRTMVYGITTDGIDPVYVALFYGELRQHMSSLASHALNKEVVMCE